MYNKSIILDFLSSEALFFQQLELFFFLDSLLLLLFLLLFSFFYLFLLSFFFFLLFFLEVGTCQQGLRKLWISIKNGQVIAKVSELFAPRILALYLFRLCFLSCS